MWQRFTENARKAVFHAQEAAQQLGQGYVSTEHLLLGLLRLHDCTAVKMLVAIGVDPEDLRRKTLEVVTQSGFPEPEHDMTLTPRAKRVIDLAYDEARHFEHNYIGSEHLLLGLIREGDGLAGRVLTSMGIELDALRTQMGATDGGRSHAAAAPRPKARCAALALLGLMLTDPTPVLAAVFERRSLDPSILVRLLSAADYGEKATLEELMFLANVVATERGDDDVNSDHLLLAILSHDNFAATMLQGLGIDAAFVSETMAAPGEE